MAYQRYAIFWTPPPGSQLFRLGRAWFGSDPETGEASGAQNTFGLTTELAGQAVKSPRLYGLHATMKAPFRLAPGMSEDDLAEELDRFCSKRRRIEAGPLALQRLSRFLALGVKKAQSEIGWLADSCVTHFDRFRAPLNDADRERRGSDFPPVQKLHFEQFGYPYIFSHFVFHITLAGPLEPRALDAVATALRPGLASAANEDFVMDGLTLLGDPGDGSVFRTVARFPLMA